MECVQKMHNVENLWNFRQIWRKFHRFSTLCIFCTHSKIRPLPPPVPKRLLDSFPYGDALGDGKGLADLVLVPLDAQPVQVAVYVDDPRLDMLHAEQLAGFEAAGEIASK